MAGSKGKEFPLSIVLRTVDNATAGLRRINERMDRLTEPVRKLNHGFRAMAREAGLPRLAAGFRRIGREVGRLALGVGAIAAAAGLSTRALKGMIDEGDNLAKTADRVGITIDGLAQLRHAANLAGIDAQTLDDSMDRLNKRLGEAKAGSGQLASFLSKVSPELLRQVKAAESSEEAFGLMADAMAKLKDPAKKAALANAAFGRSGIGLVNLLSQGGAAIEAQKQEYAELAGSQEASARSSEKINDALTRVSASMSGVKASIVSGLAPAILELAEQFGKFFGENREAIAAWVKDFGEKLPGRIDALGKKLKGLVAAIKPVWDAIGGMSGAVKILAVAMTSNLIISIVQTVIAMKSIAGAALAASTVLKGKLLASVKTLWAALAANPIGAVVAAIALVAPLIIEHWDPIKKFFGGMWDWVVEKFEWAWKKIAGIVDKVKGAASGIKNAITFWREETTGKRFVDSERLFGEGGLAGLTGRRPALVSPETADTVRSRMGPGQSPARETRVKVDITGAPRGTRTEVDPQSDADIDLSLGYQLGLP